MDEWHLIFSPCVIERDTMSLHPTFVEYMDGARLYLEMETDKDNSSIREVKIHFCDFIRKMIKNFSCKLNMVETMCCVRIYSISNHYFIN